MTADKEEAVRGAIKNWLRSAVETAWAVPAPIEGPINAVVPMSAFAFIPAKDWAVNHPSELQGK